MDAVGMHVFAGSFTLGMRRHHNVLMHLEDGTYGVETMRRNQPDVEVHTDPDTWPVEELAERKIDIVYGNPPCAPFSNSGSIKRDADYNSNPLKDDRVNCIRQMVDVLERVMPRFWVFESVTQAHKNGGALLQRIERTAERLGYNVTHFLHDVNYYGNVQRRKRYFCIVHDTPLNVRAPEWEEAPTVGDMAGEIFLDEEERGPAYVPVNETSWEMWRQVMPELPQGGKLRQAFLRRWPGRSENAPLSMTGRRMDTDAPSLTMMGPYRFIHPTEDRLLSVQEHARVQGFPADYEFTGSSQTAKCDEAARGVCTHMGDYLGKLFADAEDREPEQQGVIVVDFRTPPGRIIFARTFD